ncbi:MAG: DUF1320 domain-containing protein [Candidatus Contendobacter sp.]|nr:MAG: DUF1320 domain-containing protein [Candidatus Contendobacter sp.]
MAYATRAQLDAALAPALLAQLTDDTAGTTADEAVIAEAMAQADAEMDLYLGQVVTTPLPQVPPVLARIAVQLTIYFLYLRRNVADETRLAEYRNCTRILGEIAAGKLRLEALTAETPEASRLRLVAL